METRIEELISFITKYGEDFLEDGTKELTVKALQQGNQKLALDILNCLDREWMERTREVEKFYIFTDSQFYDAKGNRVKEPFYRTSYMDSCNPKSSHIPVLRRVKAREFGTYEMPKPNDGWEIDE